MKTKKKTKKPMDVKAKIWLGFKLLFSLITIVFSAYCIKVVHGLDMLPAKIFVIFVVVYVLLNILTILGLIFNKTKLNIAAISFALLIILLSGLGIQHGNKLANFMNSAFNNDGIEVTEYNIAVLKSSNYNELTDLDGKIVAFAILDEKKEEYVNVIDSKISATLKAYDSNMQIYEDLLKKKVDAIIVTSGFMQILEDEYEDVNDKIKIIYNFEIEKPAQKEEKKEENVTSLQPVNILISGSDSRTGVIVDKTQSDVNMIVTINPKSHKILLTSIPRDYYVQLHGTTGLKDKLTNSGVYGINMTKKTVEDLFDIKIKYTLKVGFKSVIKIVDLVGGVDIYSDTAFQSHCDDGGAESVKVKVGMNHFNGAQVLSYARERYAYRNGDYHRIKNQQQVLEAVIKKVSKDKSILLKYDEILDSIKDAYKTNIPSKFIKLIVKEQLDNMPSWKIETQSVKGGGYMRETYSVPGKLRSVEIPDMDSVKKATKKIKKLTGEE